MTYWQRLKALEKRVANLEEKLTTPTDIRLNPKVLAEATCGKGVKAQSSKHDLQHISDAPEKKDPIP